MFFPGFATYTCDVNFELVNGPQTRMCQTDGTWSGIEPTCQGKALFQLFKPP